MTKLNILIVEDEAIIAEDIANKFRNILGKRPPIRTAPGDGIVGSPGGSNHHRC